MKIPFLKMHGAANDFVVVDHREAFLAEPLEGIVGGCAIAGAAWARTACCWSSAIRSSTSPCATSMPTATPRTTAATGRAASRASRSTAAWAGPARCVSAPPRESRSRAETSGAGASTVRFGQSTGPASRSRSTPPERSFPGRAVRAGVPHFVTGVERVEWVPVEGVGLRSVITRASSRRAPT